VEIGGSLLKNAKIVGKAASYRLTTSSWIFGAGCLNVYVVSIYRAYLVYPVYLYSTGSYIVLDGLLESRNRLALNWGTERKIYMLVLGGIAMPCARLLCG